MDPKLLEEILSQTELTTVKGSENSSSSGSNGDDGSNSGGGNGNVSGSVVSLSTSPGALSSSNSTLGSRLGAPITTTQSNTTFSHPDPNHGSPEETKDIDTAGAAAAGVGALHSVRDRWHELAETSPEPMSRSTSQSDAQSSQSSQSHAASSQSNSESLQSKAQSNVPPDPQLVHSESSFSIVPSTKAKTRLPSPQSNSQSNLRAPQSDLRAPQSNLRAPQSLSSHDLESSQSHNDVTDGDSQCDMVLLSSIGHDNIYDGKNITNTSKYISLHTRTHTM